MNISGSPVFAAKAVVEASKRHSANDRVQTKFSATERGGNLKVKVDVVTSGKSDRARNVRHISGDRSSNSILTRAVVQDISHNKPGRLYLARDALHQYADRGIPITSRTVNQVVIDLEKTDESFQLLEARVKRMLTGPEVQSDSAATSEDSRTSVDSQNSNTDRAEITDQSGASTSEAVTAENRSSEITHLTPSTNTPANASVRLSADSSTNGSETSIEARPDTVFLNTLFGLARSKCPIPEGNETLTGKHVEEYIANTIVPHVVNRLAFLVHKENQLGSGVQFDAAKLKELVEPSTSAGIADFERVIQEAALEVVDKITVGEAVVGSELTDLDTKVNWTDIGVSSKSPKRDYLGIKEYFLGTNSSPSWLGKIFNRNPGNFRTAAVVPLLPAAVTRGVLQLEKVLNNDAQPSAVNDHVVPNITTISPFISGLGVIISCSDLAVDLFAIHGAVKKQNKAQTIINDAKIKLNSIKAALVNNSNTGIQKLSGFLLATSTQAESSGGDTWKGKRDSLLVALDSNIDVKMATEKLLETSGGITALQSSDLNVSHTAWDALMSEVGKATDEIKEATKPETISNILVDGTLANNSQKGFWFDLATNAAGVTRTMPAASASGANIATLAGWGSAAASTSMAFPILGAVSGGAQMVYRAGKIYRTAINLSQQKNIKQAADSLIKDQANARNGAPEANDSIRTKCRIAVLNQIADRQGIGASKWIIGAQSEMFGFGAAAVATNAVALAVGVGSAATIAVSSGGMALAGAAGVTGVALSVHGLEKSWKNNNDGADAAAGLKRTHLYPRTVKADSTYFPKIAAQELSQIADARLTALRSHPQVAASFILQQLRSDTPDSTSASVQAESESDINHLLASVNIKSLKLSDDEMSLTGGDRTDLEGVVHLLKTASFDRAQTLLMTLLNLN